MQGGAKNHQPLTTMSKNKKLSYRRGTRDASCQLKSCQLPRNSAETTYTTSPEQIGIMKLEGEGGPMCNKHLHSTVMRLSCFHCLIGVINKLSRGEFGRFWEYNNFHLCIALWKLLRPPVACYAEAAFVRPRATCL